MSVNRSGKMTRRHFARHVAAAATTVPSLEFLTNLQANAAKVRKNQKACILMWMGGGPPTIDIWDLKPGSKNGGEFKPISTKGNMQISEHMPKTAQVMDNLSLIRSMSTREADHTRGRYYLQTSYVPNPTVIHPSFGSVVSYELGAQRTDLEIPSFISVGGGGLSPGFLGMMHAPFTVDSNGQIRNANAATSDLKRLDSRLSMLDSIETSFIKSNRGELPVAHRDVYKKAVNLMTSDQMSAFDIEQEDPKTIEMYTNSASPTGVMNPAGNAFGRGLLMARRLVETGVPFIEVRMGGWDLHANVFDTLSNQQLPVLDNGIATLTQDLKDRGMLDDVVLVWMGEFGRTPRINANTGRDHWAATWSIMVGGGGLNGGVAVGKTDFDGTSAEGKTYLPGDVWATVSHAMGIPTNKIHTSKRGRPMKIANGGQPIKELIG